MIGTIVFEEVHDDLMRLCIVIAAILVKWVV